MTETASATAPQAPADFGTLSDLVKGHARARPDHPAIIQDDRTLSYGAFDARIDRVAAALQRDGLKSRDVIAVCALSSIEYALVYLGALRAGVAVAPLSPSSTPEVLAAMIADCGATIFFTDAAIAREMERASPSITAKRVALDGSAAGEAFAAWLAPEGARPEPVAIDPEQPFNIIYSSGTTGMPKGIVQSHRMRWIQFMRVCLYQPDSVTLISTGLYSNTTLVSFLPTFAGGGTVVLMAKFDALKFLKLAEKHRVTDAMLVPVQYRRLLLETPEFDSFDLSSFRLKYCTSAPFSAELKAECLKRWPGGLVEYYGMTEGGGTCVLLAHEHPDKLHTVGQPAEGHDIRLIDEQGKVITTPGEVGEIVGFSQVIMNEYHNRPDKTAEATWHDALGRRFIRTGDMGRFDADGFLQLMDRKKDMIITGGFNVYPSDLEGELLKHEAVAEAAVVGAPSDKWGETPVAFVTLRPGAETSGEDVRQWANARLGKIQRIADIVVLDSLPRSHIGKVLKRELRDGYAPARPI
jgi:long-chain acyl-CoA synthetase